MHVLILTLVPLVYSKHHLVSACKLVRENDRRLVDIMYNLRIWGNLVLHARIVTSG